MLKRICDRCGHEDSDVSNELERITNNPTYEDLKPLRDMLQELDRGLPRATSAEVLCSRCDW